MDNPFLTAIQGTTATATAPQASSGNPFLDAISGSTQTAPAKVANPNVPTQYWNGQQIPASIPTKNLVAYDPATGNKTFNLGNAGAGVYTVDRNNQPVKGGHTTYGGVAPVSGQQRDDIIPAGLGGTNANAGNINLVPNSIATKQDKVETNLSKQVKSGQIQPKAAIPIALAEKQAIADKPGFWGTIGNILGNVKSGLQTGAAMVTGKTQKTDAVQNPVTGLINMYKQPSDMVKTAEASIPNGQPITKLAARVVLRTIIPMAEGFGTLVGGDILGSNEQANVIAGNKGNQASKQTVGKQAQSTGQENLVTHKLNTEDVVNVALNSIQIGLLVAPLVTKYATQGSLKLADAISENSKVPISYSDLQQITSSTSDAQAISRVGTEKFQAYQEAASTNSVRAAVKQGYIELAQKEPSTFANILRNAATRPISEIGNIAETYGQPIKETTPPLLTEKAGQEQFANPNVKPAPQETPTETYANPGVAKNLALAEQAKTAALQPKIAPVTPVTAPETAIAPKVEDAAPTLKIVQGVDNNGVATKNVQINATPVNAPFAEAQAFAKQAGLTNENVDAFLNLNSKGEIYQNEISLVDPQKVMKVYQDFQTSKGQVTKPLPTSTEKPVENAQAGFVSPKAISESVKGKITSAKDLIAETQKGLTASSNLEDSLFKIKQAAKADKLQAAEMIKNSPMTNTDAEAIYHYQENKSESLTPKQQELYNTEIKPLADESARIVAKLKPLIPINEENYTPRIIKGKGNMLDRLVEKGKAMKGGMGSQLSKSAPSLQKRTMKALVDDKGNRTVVSIKDGRVTKFSNKTKADLGAIKLKTNEQLMNEDIKPLQQKLANLQKKLDGIGQIKIKDPVSVERINKVVSELYNISTESRHLAEENTPQVTKNIQGKINNVLDEAQQLKEGIEGYSKFAYSDKGVAVLKRQIANIDAKIEQLKLKKADTATAKAIQVEKTRLIAKAKILTERLKTLESIKKAPELTNIQGRIKAIQNKMVELSNAMGQVESKFNPNELNNRKFVAKGGKTYTIKEATTKEIEQHTSLTYYHNALVNNTINYLKLRQAERAVDFLEAYKESPEFKSIAVKFGEGLAPDGWRPSALRTFSGYVFEPHVAAVLDDFNKSLINGADPLKILTAVNSFLRTSIFFNPLIHVPNIANHWFVARGVTPFVNPKAYGRLVKTSVRAINAVLRQNADYVDMLKQGANLLYADENVKNLNALLLQKMATNIETDPQLKFFREKLPNFVKWLNPYKLSGKITWAVNDIATMQSIYENMELGMTMEQAIQETGKHIPNYRIPANVLGSEAVSKFLKNPNITMFSAYHYGALKSYVETAKDLGSGDIKKTGDALNRLAMLALITLVLYPQLDKLAKKITGNAKATFRRAGASTFLSKTIELAEGKIDVSQYITTFLTPAPASKESLQQVFNLDFYTKQTIRTPGQTGLTQLKESATHAGLQVSPAQQYQRISSGSISGKEYIASLFGISSPKSTPTEKIIQNMIYDEKPKLQAKLKPLVESGKIAEAQKLVNDFNDRLKQMTIDALKEAGQSTDIMDSKLKAQYIKLPGARAIQNYQQNKSKTPLQKILK